MLKKCSRKFDLLMEEIAYAKINLALHVRGKDADGYHRIETLFAFAEDGDHLQVGPAEKVTLVVQGPFAGALGNAGDNLALRAAEALRSRYRIHEGAAITLDKRLPVASGIGGGSADAAAAIRLLVRWWGINASQSELQGIARDIGADVPACLRSETVRGEGKGDILVPESGTKFSGTPLLLVNPGTPLSTAAVFSAWDGVDRGALSIAPSLVSSRNDLEAPASSLAPQIRDVLAALAKEPGAALVRMSGSGATCFALFDTVVNRDAAARAIASMRPDWWQLKTCIR